MSSASERAAHRRIVRRRLVPVVVFVASLAACGGIQAPHRHDAASQPRAAAPPSGPSAVGRGSQAESAWAAPCRAGEPDHDRALADLAALSKAIDDLPLDGDPRPLAKRLAAIHEARCFDVGESFDGERVATALSLETYWRDGGKLALSSRLAWGGAPKDRWLWQPPSVRTALTKESAPSHPLASLLCPARVAIGPMPPGTCGHETEGWGLRLSHALTRHARARRASFIDADPAGSFPKSYRECKDAAANAAPETAFVAFSECMSEASLHRDALPLGRFQAPKDGWLVLRGTRGHEGWCNEIRAYDLATGAAYVASTCGGMFTPKQTAVRVGTGRVALDAIREAAWMIFFANTADRDVVVSGEGRHIPDAIAIRAPTGRGSSRGISVGSSSGRTTLVYQWVRAGKSIATGTTSWPDADDGAGAHATELLAVAEAGFTPGCAPASLPGVPWAARSNPTTRIADPENDFPAYDDADFAQLEQAIERVGRTIQACR